MNDTGPCCENCRFWHENRCRRYPPQIYTEEDCSFVAFPLTSKYEWCGEWDANTLTKLYIEKTYE